jgi:hypothetical protein
MTKRLNKHLAKAKESAKTAWSRHKTLHCKKGSRFSRPQPRCHLPNSPCPGIIKLFPARERLVSDIPAGDGKIENLFYSIPEEIQYKLEMYKCILQTLRVWAE